MKFLLHFLSLACVLSAQTIIDLGDGEITSSTVGLTDAHVNVSGDSLGAVSFDLTITPINGTVQAGAEGFGVSGGSSNALLDNSNDLDLSNDEGVTFTLSNVQNLPADTELKITAIKLLFGANKLYSLDSGATESVPGDTSVVVSQLETVTIYSRGADSVATNNAFALDTISVELVSTDGGGGVVTPPTVAENAIVIDSFLAESDGQMTLNFESVAGRDYVIQSSTNLESGSWSDVGTLTGDGNIATFTENLGSISLTPKNFYRVCEASGPLVTDQVLEIEQTWAEEPAGYTRTALVKVPTSGTGPFPVCLMLHGSGGNTSFVQSMGNRLDSIIRIAPQGYGNQWNVDGEANTDAPDVDFIRQLIALVKTYSNVDPNNITIMGSSNGSGMTNRLIIDLEAGTFHKAAGKVSQMIVKMYDTTTNEFKYTPDSTSVAYDQVKVPASGIKIINMTGTADTAVPYLGGSGVGTVFHDSQDSIYWFAQAMGETGAQIADAAGVAGDGVSRPADIVEYSYLGGDVVHYKVIGGNHGLGPYASESSDIMADFILNQ